jgi:NAD(P)-dependent dehydrogenase (short-subunit alcohol dehydrogenase family)
VDGYERQIQSNHLGHFVLTKLLMPKLTPKARIINVSSTAHQFQDFVMRKLVSILITSEGRARPGPWRSYGQSKLANLLFTQELQRRIDAAGLGYTTITMHPGVVDTDLGRNLVGIDNYEKLKSGKVYLYKSVCQCQVTSEEGASTQIWLASGMVSRNAAATYYIDCKERRWRPDG